MKVVQCDFEHEFSKGVSKTTAWVDASKAKIGSLVTFKDDYDGTKWKIVRVGLNFVDIADIKDTWEVGGITESTVKQAKKKKWWSR